MKRVNTLVRAIEALIEASGLSLIERSIKVIKYPILEKANVFITLDIEKVTDDTESK